MSNTNMTGIDATVERLVYLHGPIAKTWSVTSRSVGGPLDRNSSI